MRRNSCLGFTAVAVLGAIMVVCQSPGFCELPEKANIGQLLVDRCGSLSRPVHCLAGLLLEDPDNPDLLAARAFALASEGRLEAALADLQRAIALDPSDPALFTLRGSVRTAIGDSEGAERDFEHSRHLKESADPRLSSLNEVLVRNPDDVKSLKERAEVRQERRDLHGALEDLERYFRLVASPPNAMTYLQLASLRLATGNPTGAVLALSSGLERYSDFSDMRALLLQRRAQIRRNSLSDETGAQEDDREYDEIVAQLRHRKAVERIADYTALIEEHPDDLTAHYKRGRARLELGDLDGALADANRAIEIDRDAWYGYSLRSEVRRALGDFEGSLADRETLESLSHPQ